MCILLASGSYRSESYDWTVSEQALDIIVYY